MAFTIFYTDFKSASAMDLGVDWLETLDRAVRRAAVRAVMMDFTHSSGQHAAYGQLLDRLRPTRTRTAAERWYRARLGYVIEAEANAALLRSASRGRGWRCLDEKPFEPATAGDFLLQSPAPHGPFLPCDFRGARGEGSRPDVRVALGDRTEALFDITSRGEEGHVLDKGGGHWVGMPSVAFIAEVIYDEGEVGETLSRR